MLFPEIVTVFICRLAHDWAAVVYRDKLKMGGNSNTAPCRRGVEELGGGEMSSCWRVLDSDSGCTLCAGDEVV